MTREEVKKLIPVLRAFAEGKDIQIEENDGTFADVSCIMTDMGYNYRIKPQPKYRPFKDAEECWQEMQKHQPFGWVKNKGGEERYNIVSIDTKYIYFSPTMSSTNYNIVFDEYVFVDGEPFGAKEEA